MSSTLGCSVGDITVVNTGSTCALSSVTAVNSTTTVTLQNTSGAVVGANLACLGTWNEITFAVNPATGNLDRTIGGVTRPSVVGVVNMQAQYGISAAANSNAVTQWVNASGAWAAPTVADRKRIKAIRIAVVARNENLATATVTTTCSSTTAAAPTGLCAWEGSAASPAPAVDLSADANWARYRYRVFDSIIPLRNVIWSKETL
jgi:type IV pilus assembly protein PilW